MSLLCVDLPVARDILKGGRINELPKDVSFVSELLRFEKSARKSKPAGFIRTKK